MISKYLKHFYFLFVLIVSMEGSMYYRTKEMMMARVVIAVLLMFLYKIKPDRKLIYALSVWTFFVSFCYFITNDFQPAALLRYSMLFIESFLLIKLFGLNIFQVYIKTMLVMAIISLFFFVLSNISLSTVFNAMKVLDFSGGFREKTGDYIHAGFITIHNRIFEQNYNIARNAGFCWEPGPFSILIVLAIFFNKNYNKRSYKSKAMVILLITLLTTLSTTGILVFVFYITYELMLKSKKPQYIILLVLILGISLFVFNKLEFLGGKIEKYSKQGAYAKKRDGRTYVTGSRLAGLPLVSQDIYRNPFSGKSLTSTSKYDYWGEIDSSYLNTIFTILSSMGLFGFFFWYYFIVKSSKKYKQIFGLDGSFGFLIIISAASFGFNLHVWSILFCFVTFGYFYTNDNKRKYLNSKEV